MTIGVDRAELFISMLRTLMQCVACASVSLLGNHRARFVSLDMQCYRILQPSAIEHAVHGSLVKLVQLGNSMREIASLSRSMSILSLLFVDYKLLTARAL